MAKATPARILKPDDVLYRKIEPGFWDRATGEVADDAFVDQYENQSFFAGSKKTPREVLDSFAKMKGMRDRFGGEELTAEDLYDLGFGIAAVRVGDLKAQGLEFMVDGNGNQISKSGHVDVVALRERPHLAAIGARALTREELFG